MFAALKKTLHYRKLLAEGKPNLRVFLVTEDLHLAEAQRLHAKVYLDRKFIEQEHVGPDGLIKKLHDPHSAHSQYFAVAEEVPEGERIIATARQILTKLPEAHSALPAIDKLTIDPRIEAKIRSLAPEACVEISALAKAKGSSTYAVLMLYRAMWQHSLSQQHKLWVMACDVDVYKNLKFLFGAALVEIGKPTFYMGSNVVPAVLEIDRSLDMFLRPPKIINPARLALHKSFVKFYLEGLSDDYTAAARKRVLATSPFSKMKV